MSNKSSKTGGYHTGEREVVIRPRNKPTQDRYGVIYCHGATADARVATGIAGSGQPTLLQRIADIGGYNIFVADLGSSLTNWGNSEAMSRMDEAFTYVVSTLGFRSGKVHLIGASMGHVVNLRWTIADKTRVASITGIIPAYDMQAIRVNASGAASNDTLKGQIDTAYSVVYPAALPAHSNPPDDIASIAGIPYENFYASDDVTEFVAGAAAAASALSGTSTSLGALGHTDTAIGSASARTIVDFMAAHD